MTENTQVQCPVILCMVKLYFIVMTSLFAELASLFKHVKTIHSTFLRVTYNFYYHYFCSKLSITTLYLEVL